MLYGVLTRESLKSKKESLLLNLKIYLGRPNWDKVFTKLRMERKGDITVFYCGNQTLGKILRSKCEQFGFRFRKEVF